MHLHTWTHAWTHTHEKMPRLLPCPVSVVLCMQVCRRHWNRDFSSSLGSNLSSRASLTFECPFPSLWNGNRNCVVSPAWYPSILGQIQVEGQPGLHSQLGGYAVRVSLTKGVCQVLKRKRTVMCGHIKQGGRRPRTWESVQDSDFYN